MPKPKQDCCEFLSDIRTQIDRYLTQNCESPAPTPGLPCPDSSDSIIIDKSGTYNLCNLRGQMEIKAPDVTIEGMRLEGTNPDYTLLTAHHTTKLINCDLIGSPNGQHRGIRVDAGGIRLINTRVFNIWKDGQDTQAVAGWDGCKDLIIEGGEYSASSENIMFGGSVCSSEENIPQDILIDGAYLWKDLIWRKRERGEVNKNLFELKNAKRLTIKNCRMQYSWGNPDSGQGGVAIVLTVRQEWPHQPVSFNRIEDITIENNEIESVGMGFNFLGVDDSRITEHVMSNILIRNNNFKDFDRHKWEGDGRQFQIGLGSKNLQIIGNKFPGPKENFYTIISFYGYEQGPDYPYINEGFVFDDNEVNEGKYAVHGAGMEVTGVLEALARYAPGYSWKNDKVNDKSGYYIYPS